MAQMTHNIEVAVTGRVTANGRVTNCYACSCGAWRDGFPSLAEASDAGQQHARERAGIALVRA